jgi:phosphotransferase system HPr-like phosphotransfer protein
MMDWENMSDIKKRLVAAMMIGKMYEENMGILVKRDTKLMLEDKEFHYEGTEFRAKKGDILELGATEEDKEAYEVLETSNDDNSVVLKKVIFFKARITTSYNSMEELCVAGSDRTEAMKALKNYMKNGDYTRIISLNPSKFFKPLVK